MTPDLPCVAGLVSIIIPTRDRRGELAECLGSIQQQDYPQREVIVADDHSEDDTAEYVRQTHPDVKLIVTDQRRQPAHLRNLGLRAARGEFVLFLDSDSELPRADWLSTMLSTLKANPEVVILGGEIKVHSARPDEAYGRNVRINGETCPVVASSSTPEALVECDYVATCNCFGRADAMRKAGGFDPYFGFGGEDVDFCLRVARGSRCRVSYATAVKHKQSPRGRNPDETYRYHVARVRQQIKNAGAAGFLAGMSYDLIKVALFHIALIPKLIIKLARRKQLRSENFTGGYLVVKAYAVNLLRVGSILAARKKDFLAVEEMAAFEHTKANR